MQSVLSVTFLDIKYCFFSNYIFFLLKNLDSGGIRYVEDKRTGETDGRCLPGDQKENVTQ